MVDPIEVIDVTPSKIALKQNIEDVEFPLSLLERNSASDMYLFWNFDKSCLESVTPKHSIARIPLYRVMDINRSIQSVEIKILQTLRKDNLVPMRQAFVACVDYKQQKLGIGVLGTKLIIDTTVSEAQHALRNARRVLDDCQDKISHDLNTLLTDYVKKLDVKPFNITISYEPVFELGIDGVAFGTFEVKTTYEVSSIT